MKEVFRGISDKRVKTAQTEQPSGGERGRRRKNSMWETRERKLLSLPP